MRTWEQLFAILKKYVDEHGGGGGGTTNYNLLSNQPQINGITLVGNKTSEDLGLDEMIGKITDSQWSSITELLA